MIELNFYEKQWILLCKGHLQDKYPYTGHWHNTLKPLFAKIYGWNPDENNDYQQYLNVVFFALLNLYLKIKDDWSNPNAQLQDLFNAAFYKGISNNSELPIERAIHTVCGLIANNIVYEKGIQRYTFEDVKEMVLAHN